MKKFFKLGKGLKRSGSETSNHSSSNWSLNSGGSKESAGKGSADFKEKDFHKIHKAALNGDIEKLKECVKKQYIDTPDKQKRTPLHIASRQGHEQMVQYILKDLRAKPNVIDNEGATPLLHAIQGHNDKVCEELLKYDADTNVQDRHGACALHYAARDGLVDIIANLLENQADLDLVDNENQTPLHYACQHGMDEAVEYLLHEGSNPNARDKSTKTPLMLSCRTGHLNTARLLIFYKADPTLKDASKLSAADHANQTRNADCLHFVQTEIKKVRERGLTPDKSFSEEEVDKEGDGDEMPGQRESSQSPPKYADVVNADEEDVRGRVDSWGDDEDDDFASPPNRLRLTSEKSLQLVGANNQKSDSLEGVEDDVGNATASVRRTLLQQSTNKPLVTNKADNINDGFDSEDESWVDDKNIRVTC